MNSKTKGLIFDVGGVLVDLDLDRCKRAFVEKLGYTNIDNLLDAYHQKGFYSDFEEGLLTADQFREKVLEGSRPGANPQTVDECMKALLVGVEPYKIELLRELKKDYKLFILSNNNAISMQFCRAFFADAGCPAEELFDKQFVSYEMKLLKPSREIFMTVISQTGMSAEELLFIDDSKANVEAGEAAGIPGLLYCPGTDLRTALEARLASLSGLSNVSGLAAE